MSEKIKYSDDTVAVWKVPLADGVHEVEFEHGTATGKRVVKLDGRVSVYPNKMLKIKIPLFSVCKKKLLAIWTCSILQ